MAKAKAKTKSVHAALWHALDEAAFGPDRILNLRESLPSATEARAHADAWLRTRQVLRSEEVLIITGRGNQSANRIGVLRREILLMLPLLRRRGVVVSWREHNPGAFVIVLAPMSALFTAPRRKRDGRAPDADSDVPPSLSALEPGTLKLLQRLAVQNLELLGVADPRQFVSDEMVRTFSMLAAAIPDADNKEERLRDAILSAIDEASD